MTLVQRKRVYIDSQVQGALTRQLVIHWAIFIAVAMVLAICIQFLGNPLRSLPEHA